MVPEFVQAFAFVLSVSTLTITMLQVGQVRFFQSWLGIIALSLVSLAVSMLAMYMPLNVQLCSSMACITVTRVDPYGVGGVSAIISLLTLLVASFMYLLEKAGGVFRRL